jgi:hypothetical protein
MRKLLQIKPARAVKLAVLLAMAAMLTLAFTACGPSSEQIIREGLEAQLDEVKDPNSKTMVDIRASLEDLESLGVDPEAFTIEWLDEFEYSIGEITITKDFAAAVVEITTKQFGPVFDVYMQERQVMATDPMYEDLTEEEALSRAADAMMDGIGRTTPVTLTVQLDCVLADKTWSPAPSFEKVMQEVLIGKSQYL